MSIHKTGVVLSPINYKNWQAEYVGDPTDTGGIYVILRNAEHSKHMTFWEDTIEAIEQTLRDQKITILWEGEKTISYFLNADYLTKKLAKEIIHNFYEQTRSEIVFNLTQLDFDFSNSLVILAFFYEDQNCPDIVFSFEQLETLLMDYLRQ